MLALGQVLVCTVVRVSEPTRADSAIGRALVLWHLLVFLLLMRTLHAGCCWSLLQARLDQSSTGEGAMRAAGCRRWSLELCLWSSDSGSQWQISNASDPPAAHAGQIGLKPPTLSGSDSVMSSWSSAGHNNKHDQVQFTGLRQQASPVSHAVSSLAL